MARQEENCTLNTTVDFIAPDLPAGPLPIWILTHIWYRRVDSDHQPTGYESVALPLSYTGIWYTLTGSNRRPSACKADALPTELSVHNEKPAYLLCRSLPLLAQTGFLNASNQVKDVYTNVCLYSRMSVCYYQHFGGSGFHPS